MAAEKTRTPEHFIQRIQDAKEQRLEELDLSNDWYADEASKLTEIPEEVFELKHLKVLKLAGNRLRELPRELFELKNLSVLYITGNQLKYLPKELGNLSNLTELNLFKNNLEKLPEEIGSLTKLKRLIVGENKLKILPNSIANLSNLEELDLRSNKLTILSDQISNLTNLIRLDLDYNEDLRSLPENIGDLKKIERIYLSHNLLLEKPPIEVARRGIEAIREYFLQLQREGEVYIYEAEAKLIIVGEPGAGKTTLAKKIENPEYKLQQDEETTKGINIINWTFLSEEKNPSFSNRARKLE